MPISNPEVEAGDETDRIIGYKKRRGSFVTPCGFSVQKLTRGPWYCRRQLTTACFALCDLVKPLPFLLLCLLSHSFIRSILLL